MQSTITKEFRYLNGLYFAAYVTWAAVTFETLRRVAELRTPAGFEVRWIAAACCGTFLFALLWSRDTDANSAPVITTLRAVLMACSVLGLAWLTGSSSVAPALLTVLASMLVFTCRPLVAGVALVAVNLALVAILLFYWRAADTWIVLLLFGGFQVFAVLTSYAVRRADGSAADLRAVNANLLATRALLEEAARDSERLRLSRELHDVAGHKLTALKLNLDLLGNRPEFVGEKGIAAAADLTQQLLDDIRAVVSQLRQHDGIELGFALRQLAESIPAPAVHVSVANNARVEDAEHAKVLLRVAQEGLTNAARHAEARNVWMTLTRDNDAMQLRVEDDGSGIKAQRRPGFGLVGIRERLAEIGGTLNFDDRREGGSTLTVRIPHAGPA